MSTEPHPTPPVKDHEHGAMVSYVVGFILSLIFTINPYIIVTRKMVTGNALIAIILAFAVGQMFIQLIFFLHLGRGPKPLYNVLFFVATAGIILVTIGGSIFIMNNLYRNMSPAEVTTKLAQGENLAEVSGKTTGACSQTYTTYKVVIKDGIATPSQTSAKRCDAISFVDEDSAHYAIVFKQDGESVSYGGNDQATTQKGYPKTINLNQTGTFIFSDSNNPEVNGQFTVTDR